MLLDALTRSSSHFLAALMLLLLSSSVSLAREDDFFIKEIMSPQEEHQDKIASLPEWLKTKPASLSPVLEQLLRKGSSVTQNNGLSNTDKAHSTEKPIQGKWIFVSMGMPTHELKAAANEASMTGSVLVFRGVEKSGDTGTITRGLYDIVKDIKPVPSAVIDPMLFTRFNVLSAPTMVETNADGETRVVRGLPGFVWLGKQETGDLGQKGPVFEIVEPDMIEEMQRRMAEFDWDKEKKHAIDNFWAHQKDSVSLPVSVKNTERKIDTSIVSTQDIFHPDGRLIIKKGQTIDPQALMPMRHVYILFDATNKRQVEVAKKIGDEMLAKQKPVVYLFSKMDTGKGWEHYNQTTALMNAPIYKLNKTIVERFHIQVLPSIVEGQGGDVIVREIDARVLN